jgi:hypothetical protein
VQTTVIGRETELSALLAFLAGSDPALVLDGEAGVGKTALWRAAVEQAQTLGMHVLATTAAGPEPGSAYEALADLLEDLPADALASVPVLQRHALEVALRRTEPGGGDPPAPRGVALGLLGAVRRLVTDAPVLIAVDDVQWLDPETAETLDFLARRVGDARVRFLLAERTGARAEPVLAVAGADRLTVGALDADGVRRLLADRLEMSLTPTALTALHQASGGNALYALELGRVQRETGATVSAAVEELLGARIAALPEPVRALVLALALSPGLRRGELAQIAGDGTLDAASDAGVVVVDGGRARLAHPLLASVAISAATAAERRAAHAALGMASIDDERRARHLATATEQPQGQIAFAVAQAAVKASARGAARDAVELSEHALRLTPADDPARPDRVLALGAHLGRAGADEQLTALFAVELDRLPPGEHRVRAHIVMLDSSDAETLASYQAHLDAAAREAGDDPVLRVPVLAQRALMVSVARLERLEECDRWATEALANAPVDVLRLALSALAWVRALRGKPLGDLAEREIASVTSPHIFHSVARLAAVRRFWRGDIAGARAAIAALMDLAETRGDTWSYASMRMHAVELELRAGEWDTAEELLDAWQGPDLVIASGLSRCRALLAAGRGDASGVQRWGSEARGQAATTGLRWDELETDRAEGILALVTGRPDAAVEPLARVWDHTRAEGIDEPGAFPAAPELIEALAAVGDVAGALEVCSRLEELAAAQDHPWARLGARRGRALLAGDDAELDAVAEGYAALGLRADVARLRQRS